ncbi:hypothetical protein HK104_001626 [Borealophlyctis nickersoniae]|nr:hypothetical protein HK104_001626 [Borealophlyctis nickersoniae]
MFYWKRHGSAAVDEIRFEEIPPEVTEKIYTALVALGADPLPKITDILEWSPWSLDILEWSLVEGHVNVTRAIAAAGVNILETFDFFDFAHDKLVPFWYPHLRSVVYLVEECGLQNLIGCYQTGSDVGLLFPLVVFFAATCGSFEVLELLLDMGLEAFPEATDALRGVFRSEELRDKDALPTVKVLIRGGANIIAAVPSMNAAFGSQWWDVGLGEKYAVILSILRGDRFRVREYIEMGVAQRNLATVLLLLDVRAIPRYSMVEEAMKPAFFAIFEEFLSLCQQEDLNDLLTTALKDGNSVAVQFLLAAGADAALIPNEEHSMVEDSIKSPKSPYSAMSEEFLPLCLQEVFNDLLITAWKDGNYEGVRRFLAAGADAECCQNADLWGLSTPAAEEWEMWWGLSTSAAEEC